MKAVKNRSAVSFFSAKPEMCRFNKKTKSHGKICVCALRVIYFVSQHCRENRECGVELSKARKWCVREKI